MKVSTVALIISLDGESPCLVDTLHDEYEIEYLEVALRTGEPEPLRQIFDHRARQLKQESEFGDYVEELLSQPFLHPEVQRHGIQWFNSQIKIEKFQKSEAEAVKIISDYAFKIFKGDRSQTDFCLASPNSQVRIRVFALPAPEVNPKRDAG